MAGSGASTIKIHYGRPLAAGKRTTQIAQLRDLYRYTCAGGTHPARCIPQESPLIAAEGMWAKSDARPPEPHGDSRKVVSLDGWLPLYGRLWSDPH